MRIGIAVFEAAEELDFVGPWEVLTFWATNVAERDVEVALIGPGTDPVRCAKGLRVVPDTTLRDMPGRPELFVLPGGQGTRPLLGPDEPLHTALRRMHADGTLLASVCTGSLVLAAAGLLAGRKATTHWGSLDLLGELDPTITVCPDERYVDTGDIITAAGVSAGIDMALYLVARLDSPEAARQVRRGIQYDPQPPI